MTDTDTQTDLGEIITFPHTRMVKIQLGHTAIKQLLLSWLVNPSQGSHFSGLKNSICPFFKNEQVYFQKKKVPPA